MHIPSYPLHTTAHCNPLQPAANHPVHIQCTHCSSHYIFSTHCSKSSVHTASIIQCTHCSSHYIFSTHCSKSSVHTASIIQCTLQQIFSAHYSKYSVHTTANIQCTLQLQYLVPIPYSAHYIQCTFEPPQGKPIPLLAYLQNSQQTLMVDCSSPLDEEDWLIIAVH